MSLNLDKSDWKRVALGEVAAASKERVDPTSEAIDRYVAGEHMDTDNLKIRRWGEIGDGYLGPAFHRRFHPGQVLYGSRRTYLRKVAVADFPGVTANTTFVVETKDAGVLLQEFLPFVMTAEPFHAFAVQESKGSVNPYVNWSDIARYEFDLPPIDEQKRLADLLWSAECHRWSIHDAQSEVIQSHRAWLDATIEGFHRGGHRILGDLIAAKDVLLLTGPFGSTLSAKEFVEGGVPVIHPSHIRDGRATIDPKSTLPPDRAAQLKRWQVAAGDIVLMRKGDVGRSAIITPEQSGWIISSDCISIRLSDSASLSPQFLRLALSAPAAMSTLLRNAPGTTMPGINERSVRPISVPALSHAEQASVIERSKRMEVLAEQLAVEHEAVTAVLSSVLTDIFGGS